MSKITIEIEPHRLVELEWLAQQEGTTPEKWAEYALNRVILREQVPIDHPDRPAMTPGERAARVAAVAGMLADMPGSVDEFLAEKRAEAESEEARYERGWREQDA